MANLTKGQLGHGYFTSGAAAREDDIFSHIQAWGGTAVVTYKALVAGETSLVTFASVSIATGIHVEGYITELEVASGTVLGYYSKRGAVPEE